MKIYPIAYKDLKRIFSSPFSLVMMFGAPLLITGLLYFAFGSLTSGDANFSLPVTTVLVANLDEPQAQSGGFAAGEMLVQFLQDPSLADVLRVSLAPDAAAARAAVDDRQAGLALLIPPGFSAAATTPGARAQVVIYQDPTLTIGPGIVKDLVSHFMDGFSGARIAGQVAVSRFSASGAPAGDDLAYAAAQQYVAWQQSGGHGDHLTLLSPGGESQADPQKAVPVGPIMAGMVVFFVFFIGANEAASLIREAEEGTLARLFTTPTSQAAILGGKFLGVVVSLAVQVTLLLLGSALLFRIDWGQPATVLLVAAGLIVAAAGFGVVLMSFVKSSRQTGPVLGGVMTLAGMLGGLFTTGLPSLPAAAGRASLVTPHGWALQGWKLSLSGAGPVQALPPVLVLAGLGFVFLAVGIARFRSRFS